MVCFDCFCLSIKECIWLRVYRIASHRICLSKSEKSFVKLAHFHIYFHIPAAQTSVYIGILRTARAQLQIYEIRVSHFHDVWLLFHFRFQFQLTFVGFFLFFFFSIPKMNSEWHIHLTLFDLNGIRIHENNKLLTPFLLCPKMYRSFQMKATLQSTAIVFIYSIIVGVWVCAWIGWLEIIKTKRKINKLTGNLLNQQIPLSTTTLLNDKCKQKCATLIINLSILYAVKFETPNQFSFTLLCVIHMKKNIWNKICIALFCFSLWVILFLNISGSFSE